MRRGVYSNQSARVHVNPALAPRLAAPVSAAVPLWSLRGLRDHQGPLAPQLVSRPGHWEKGGGDTSALDKTHPSALPPHFLQPPQPGSPAPRCRNRL